MIRCTGDQAWSEVHEVTYGTLKRGLRGGWGGQVVIPEGDYTGPSADTTALDPADLFGGFSKEPDEEEKLHNLGELVISWLSCRYQCLCPFLLLSCC